MDSNGDNEIRLERLKFDASTYCFDRTPKWSPDGSKVMFISNRNEYSQHQWNIWVVNSNLSNPESLTDEIPEGPFNNPKWSPDGSKIVFTKHDESIWIMDANGSNETELYPGSLDPKGYVYDLEWSPDGLMISFTQSKYTSGGSRTIYVMELGGIIIPTPEPTSTPTPEPSETPLNTTEPEINLTTENATTSPTPTLTPTTTPPLSPTTAPTPIASQKPEENDPDFFPILAISALFVIVIVAGFVYLFKTKKLRLKGKKEESKEDIKEETNEGNKEENKGEIKEEIQDENKDKNNEEAKEGDEK